MAELDRRVRAAGWSLKSVAAHPGDAATNLQFAGPAYAHNPIGKQLTRIMNAVAGQSASSGARPAVVRRPSSRCRAPALRAEGSSSPGALRVRVVRSAQAQDATTAARSWDLSEELTGVHDDITSRPNSSTSEVHTSTGPVPGCSPSAPQPRHEQLGRGACSHTAGRKIRRVRRQRPPPPAGAARDDVVIRHGGDSRVGPAPRPRRAHWYDRATARNGGC